jgi:23S rRNA (guanosine2251-2'-O)-methyltransferase
MYLLCHNIRSLHNVGSFFRCADAFNIERIYLTGYTGKPPRAEIAKVALGSELRVPWEGRGDILPLIAELKASGVRVVALEIGEGATPLNEFRSNQPIALIVGNEVGGIEKEVIDACDEMVFIPMIGKKKSLNVSVAAGIAMYELTKGT